MAVNAGGYKVFGPTYNSTKYVRFGHEGTVNSMHEIDTALIPDDTANNTRNGEAVPTLAGKIAGINEDGYVTLASTSIAPVGLFVDDIGDIVGASGKASFYFRGGEYYISVARMGDIGEGEDEVKPGTKLYVDDEGKLTTSGSGDVVAIATTAPQVFTTGNMYTSLDTTTDGYAELNGGLFVGITLKI